MISWVLYSFRKGVVFVSDIDILRKSSREEREKKINKFEEWLDLLLDTILLVDCSEYISQDKKNSVSRTQFEKYTKLMNQVILKLHVNDPRIFFSRAAVFYGYLEEETYRKIYEKYIKVDDLCNNPKYEVKFRLPYLF